MNDPYLSEKGAEQIARCWAMNVATLVIVLFNHFDVKDLAVLLAALVSAFVVYFGLMVHFAPEEEE